jgi:hypothetical protein
VKAQTPWIDFSTDFMVTRAAKLASFWLFVSDRRGALFGVLTAFASLSTLATFNEVHADTLCDSYRRSSPEMYKLMCSGKKSTSKPAGANSTFTDSFNINTASLPTEPSSLGLETIGSVLRNTPGPVSPTFSIIKGFHRFGTGISTSGNNTFFGNDVLQRAYGSPEVDSFQPHEEAKSSLPNLNVGTSIRLVGFEGGSLTLGLSGRYNKTTNTLGGGPGLLFNWGWFSVGSGFTRERVSNFLPPITFTNFMLSARVWVCEFEYTQLRNHDGVDLGPIDILSATIEIRRMTLTLATRHLEYLRDGEVVQQHFAIQYLFSKNFSAGFLYNYIPGAISLGTQFYL